VLFIWISRGGIELDGAYRTVGDQTACAATIAVKVVGTTR
jgi:hypothetical protein